MSNKQIKELEKKIENIKLQLGSMKKEVRKKERILEEIKQIMNS